MLLIINKSVIARADRLVAISIIFLITKREIPTLTLFARNDDFFYNTKLYNSEKFLLLGAGLFRGDRGYGGYGGGHSALTGGAESF